MVRGATNRGDAHETEYLEYEAYILWRRQDEAGRGGNPPINGDVEGIAIVQRIGKLYPKTPTVLIACTARARDTGSLKPRVMALIA